MSCLSCNINPTRFAINIGTIGVPHMQFWKSICISFKDVAHSYTILDQFLWVRSIAEISPRIFEDN